MHNLHNTRDFPTHIRLPKRIYGRVKDKEILKEAFDYVCEGHTAVVLVSGYPGIGKSMLVNESIKSFVKDKKLFISGKFDQLKQNIPYAAFSAAFGNLVKRLMTESQEELEAWKTKILRALGRNGAVITEFIPELEWLIGKQNPVDPLSPKETENRLHMVVRDFIMAFPGKGHPLVIFLDDLRWADSSSVELLRYLSRNANLKNILFIGAYRENEIDENHPLMSILKEINEEDVFYRHISLLPIERNQIIKLVADTLSTGEERVVGLVEILYRKTAGNPFFLEQLLTLLHEEGHLFFNLQENRWEWDIDAIEKLEPGEDVLELLLMKLQKLPEGTLKMVKLASCFGNKFDIKTLSEVCSITEDETVSLLKPAVLNNLILVTADEANGVYTQEVQQEEIMASSSFKPAHKTFEFLHDRVQQAAYSLLSEEEKKKWHLNIGRIILKNTSLNNLEDKILSIMDHFNRSLNLISDPEEKLELAEYNLMAGWKARDSAAYDAALNYFRCGMSLLPNDAWEKAYELTYEIYLELAQAEYIYSNVDIAEDLFNTVIKKARNELEKATVYSLKIVLYAGVGNYSEAVRTGIEALTKLGIKIPLYPTKFDYLKELILYKWLMRRKKIEDLAELPEVKDPVKKKISELLSRLCSVTISSYPDLFGFIVIKAGNYAVRYGNSEMASVGFAGYGITFGSILGDYLAGERFTKVCIRLVERYDKSSSKCIIYFVIGSLISHWTQHARKSIEYLEKAVKSGIEAGDVLIIGHSHCLLLEFSYFIGTPLEEMTEIIEKKSEIAGRLRHDTLHINVAIYREVISALREIGEDTLKSVSRNFQNNNFVKIAENDHTCLATFCFAKMQLSYMAGDYRDALSAALEGYAYKDSILGFMISEEYIFYFSLVIAANYDKMSLKEKIFYMRLLNKNLRQLKKWAQACKENFLHKYLLVAAETARIWNKKEKSMALYDNAILHARESGYLQDEALANELAAKFYLSNGMLKIAKMYMTDACLCYRKWGVYAKVKQLKKEYSGVLAGVFSEESTVNEKENILDVNENVLDVDEKNQKEYGKSNKEFSNNGVSKLEADTSKTDEYGGMPDIQTKDLPDMQIIYKSIESISEITDLSEMLKSFVDIAVQSAGAERGYLIFERDGELYIEAAKDNEYDVNFGEAVPLEEHDRISKPVARYVARTLETVVLNCEDRLGIFEDDPYIERANIKSVACLPLLFQGIPVGLLYLENGKTAGVFTPERIEILKLLSAQIACVQKIQTYLQKDVANTSNSNSLYYLDPLTDREIDVIILIAEGMSNKEIADALDITVNTVKGYIKNIYSKLGVNRRMQAVTKARELGILKVKF